MGSIPSCVLGILEAGDGEVKRVNLSFLRRVDCFRPDLDRRQVISILLFALLRALPL